MLGSWLALILHLFIALELHFNKVEPRLRLKGLPYVKVADESSAVFPDEHSNVHEATSNDIISGNDFGAVDNYDVSENPGGFSSEGYDEFQIGYNNVTAADTFNLENYNSYGDNEFVDVDSYEASESPGDFSSEDHDKFQTDCNTADRSSDRTAGTILENCDSYGVMESEMSRTHNTDSVMNLNSAPDDEGKGCL